MGIILTYAVNDRQSFNNIENWIKQINENASENAVSMLVCNKVLTKCLIVDGYR
jgi:Ras-related protein Rab-8A